MTLSRKTSACLLTGGALLLASAPLAQAVAVSAPEAVGGQGAPVSKVSVAAEAADCVFQEIADIQGEFQWGQNTVVSNDYLVRHIYGAARHLCGQTSDTEPVAPNVGFGGAVDAIKVSGDVAHEFVADVGEFQEKAPIRSILGCTCSGNPHDGHATGNALVEGFRLSALIEEASLHEDVNTIVFTSADGTSLALPLSYVTQRYSVIVTTLNGEPLADVAGCENQLWLSTSGARNFLQDVVAITFETREEAPIVPAAPTAPSVGLLEGAAD
ncbi:molybdopterin-dependent oxidoreductase [Adlercreutzia sp. R25]|uniref:molybdopterin-dependent oxidoreductase n=1 Tax=Adlercreutzia shanghongiae TaxID=3111773 RepID=UPI002DBDDB61|nr:molybdopterin-dependent oxidoreductase [Adlercreutzia sp. R25]MEC4273688.1 molybdopterin-dependent oxidoreductase [Adlercreutzia sp. R25]